jgi:transposase
MKVASCMPDQRTQQGRYGPLTLAQRLTLVTAYQANGGNMAAAMRVAGIASRRTAYRWWRRFEHAGAAGLQSRPRSRCMPGYVRKEIAERVCRLRQIHQTWGRRRIAQTLAKEHGAVVVSPGGVEAALRRAGLWQQDNGRTRTPVVSSELNSQRPIRLAAIMDALRRGLAADLAADAAEATRILTEEVWAPLQQAHANLRRVLRDPRIGGWLLRSWLQLGHSLMNTGEWERAQGVLWGLQQWLGEYEQDRSRNEYEAPVEGWSLRWDDIWLECHQYLSIVLRDIDAKSSIGYLEMARRSLQFTDRRRRESLNPVGAEANIERDLAKQQLRALHLARHNAPMVIREIQSSLDRSHELLSSPPGSAGMLAATLVTKATLYAKLAESVTSDDKQERTRHLSAMEQTLHRAFDVARQESSPILETYVVLHAAQLTLPQGMMSLSAELRRVARTILAFGYGGQAQQLLCLPGVRKILPHDLFERIEERFSAIY